MVLQTTTQSLVNQSNMTIFEFSRKLLEPQWSERFNQYVSTGFDKEIGFETQSVPQEIQDAVYNRQFRLNDNYPPLKGQLALVARELDNYSVLAVATQLFDDYYRPLIGYRYFWLEHHTNHPNFDGIATLLNWWENQGQPLLNLQPTQLYSRQLQSLMATDYYQTSAVLKSPHIPDYLPETISFPHILSLESRDSFLTDYPHIHHLALKSRYSPISWCWNVLNLEHPESFLIIAYANNWAFERHLPRHNQQFSFASHSKNTQLLNKNYSSSKVKLPLPPSTVFQKVFDVLALVLKASNTLHYDKNGVIIDYNFQKRVLTFTQGEQQLIGLFSLQNQWEYLDGVLSPDTFTFITTTVKSKVLKYLNSIAEYDSVLFPKAPTIFADFLKHQQGY